MRIANWLIPAAGAVALAAALAVPPPAWAGGFGNRHVLILGIDGCRSDALLAADAPNLMALAANGSAAFNAFAGGVIGTPTQQPTVSAPGWTTILTGVWTDKHHVTENTFSGYDFTNYPHLFRRLKEYNPSAYLSSIVEWSAVDTYLVSPVNASTSFRQIAIDNTTTNLVSRAIDHLMTADPDVLFLHFHVVDTTGHSTGFSPGNPDYLAAIAQVDAGVGSLLEALPARPNYTNESWLILAVSDHGGTGTGHGGQSEAERTVFVIASGGDVPERVVMPGPGQTCVVPTVLAFLGVPIQPEWGMESAPMGVPLTNNLAVYLSFDQTLAPQGGTTNAAAIYDWPAGAAARYTNGCLGQAALFSNNGGSSQPDDWAATLGNLDWIYSNNFSVSVWLRCTGTAPATILANKSLASAGSHGWAISATDGTNVDWATSDGASRQLDLDPPLLDGAWHLVTLTFNRGANEVTTYLDGQLLSTTNLGLSGLSGLSSGLPTVIGAGGDGSYACTAEVDDLGIWTRLLSQAEVAEIHAKAQIGKALVDPYVPLPIITAQPLSQVVVQGTPTEFSVSAVGTKLGFQWRFEDVNLPGATNSVLLLLSAHPQQVGRYTVVVTNVSGAVTSAVATLTVLVPPPGATSLAVGLTGYYPFESHNDGMVTNAARTAGYAGFAQDEAILNGAEGDPSALLPPWTTNLAKVRAGAGALDCDGAGDYGDIVGNPLLLDQDWSVSVWFKPDTGGVGYLGSARAFVLETGGATYPISFGLRAGTTGNSNFQLYTDYVTGTNPYRDYQVPNANVDQWHHLVIRRTGNVIEGYLDSAMTHTINLTGTLDAYSGMRIGTYRSANGRWFKGQIDEVAFWQRALSVAEITDLQQAGQAGLTLATRIGQAGGEGFKTSLMGYYGFDAHTGWVVANSALAVGGAGFGSDALTMMGGAIDPSARIYPITHDPALARAGWGALSGDGTNDYVHIAGNPVDPNQNWSVAAWFKPDTGGLGLTDTTRAFVFETSGATYPISFGLRAGSDSSTTDFQLFTQTGTGSVSQDYLLPASQVDQWHHIVLAYDAAGGVLTGYLDGSGTYAIEPGAGALLQTYSGFNIGTYRTADGRWFKGLIDEVAFWQRKLSQAEVGQLYTLGSAGASVLTGVPEIRAFAANTVPAGSFMLIWSAAPGLKYDVEASHDLSDWSDAVVTNHTAAADTVSIIISPTSPPPANGYYDSGLSNASQRFYRVRWHP